jgi:hypothetical protein
MRLQFTAEPEAVASPHPDKAKVTSEL